MSVRVLVGDCRKRLRELPAESVHCVVTSPPYFGLRDYGVAGQIGLEATPEAYVAELVSVFGEVRRVLRKDGTVWLVIGDSYNSNSDMTRNDVKAAAGLREQARKQRGVINGTPGLKSKDLIGIPWRVAFALQADGWWLRQDIIWAKPNPMPESVTDRCTKAHEYLFLLSKSATYYYDADAVKEAAVADHGPGNSYHKYADAYNDGASEHRTKAGLVAYAQRRGPPSEGDTRNRRSVWTVATQPFSEAHFATFPPDLIEPCIKAGCPPGGAVLDPFFGAGTTGLVADRLGRNCIGIELNPAYAAMAEGRIHADLPMFAEVSSEAVA